MLVIVTMTVIAITLKTVIETVNRHLTIWLQALAVGVRTAAATQLKIRSILGSVDTTRRVRVAMIGGETIIVIGMVVGIGIKIEIEIETAIVTAIETEIEIEIVTIREMTVETAEEIQIAGHIDM